MADARSFGTKSIWDAVNVDIVELVPNSASTSVKSAWDSVSSTASTLLPAVVHARSGSLVSHSRASSRGGSVISSRASSRCNSGTSSSAESDGFPRSGSTRGHSKKSASRFSSGSSCASDHSVLPGDDFDRFACDENVSGATLPPPPPPFSNKLPILSGKAWQDATEVSQDPDDVFDEDFFWQKRKCFKAKRSATDDDLFSDPFAGMDDTGMPSSLKFGRSQTEPAPPPGPDDNGVPALMPKQEARQLPSMEQVALPQGPRLGQNGKSFKATRSATDHDLFSDPFAGMDDTGMPSSLKFSRSQTEPASFPGRDYNGVPSLMPKEKPRQLPSMGQVALPQGPRHERHAPRPQPQLAAATSDDAARGRMLQEAEEAEEEAEEEQPALARAVTTPPRGLIAPEEPQGPRPANRRPAQAKTASVRLAIAGGEKPEEPMASNGHGGTSTKVSL